MGLHRLETTLYSRRHGLQEQDTGRLHLSLSDHEELEVEDKCSYSLMGLGWAAITALPSTALGTLL